MYKNYYLIYIRIHFDSSKTITNKLIDLESGPNFMIFSQLEICLVHISTSCLQNQISPFNSLLQTVKIQIRLFLQELYDQDLYYLPVTFVWP